MRAVSAHELTDSKWNDSPVSFAWSPRKDFVPTASDVIVTSWRSLTVHLSSFTGAPSYITNSPLVPYSQYEAFWRGRLVRLKHSLCLCRTRLQNEHHDMAVSRQQNLPWPSPPLPKRYPIPVTALAIESDRSSVVRRSSPYDSTHQMGDSKRNLAQSPAAENLDKTNHFREGAYWGERVDMYQRHGQIRAERTSATAVGWGESQILDHHVPTFHIRRNQNVCQSR